MTMSFTARTYVLAKSSKKSVSLVLIVSHLIYKIIIASVILGQCIVHATTTTPKNHTPYLYQKDVVSSGRSNSNSNITLLDLYPELKEHLLKKALLKLAISTTTERYYQPHATNQYQQPYYEKNSNYYKHYAPMDYKNSISPSAMGEGQVYARVEDNHHEENAAAADTYEYEKQVLKHFYPFGTPEFWDSWKFKPSAPDSFGNGWTTDNTGGWGYASPSWEEEKGEISESHEISHDFSCLAGLLGLKTLKKIKLATIFKKLKAIGIFAVAFKLGVLLSPIALPLLFPLVLLITAVKILPLLLIVLLLLKILKKNIKIKKPLGKFLDNTGSFFFDDVDDDDGTLVLTEKVLDSDECIDKLSCQISKRSITKTIINRRQLVGNKRSKKQRNIIV